MVAQGLTNSKPQGFRDLVRFSLVPVMYTNLKQWADIRRRVLVKGESIGSVSHSERMSRNTVKKILKHEKPPGYGQSIRKPSAQAFQATHLAQAKKVKPSPESEWNAWLAGIERKDNQLVLTAVSHSQFAPLLQPQSARLRTMALTVMAHEKGFSQNKISEFLGISVNTVKKYLAAYRLSGVDGLTQRTQRAKKCDDPHLRECIFQMLHEPPTLSGINRSVWRLKDLRSALETKGVSACQETIRQVIKSAGYRWRAAKVVLTSTDPDYREKLAHLQFVLGGLLPTERFFSIDEYGPFAIKMKGGRWLVGPDENPSIPQWQQSKGWLILTAALELSTNQVTHFYSAAKNTNEMIRMIGVLVEEYKMASKLYISWDAASWHMSKALVGFIEDHNEVATENSRPVVELTPLPASAQFLNVIESVFSGMARAIIHGSNYESKDAAIEAINLYFAERNENFKMNPRRAGNKIWGKERTPSEFSSSHNCKDPAYR
jgi:transposase